MGYLDEIQDKDTMVSMAKTLQAVTEGKVRSARRDARGAPIPPHQLHLWGPGQP